MAKKPLTNREAKLPTNKKTTQLDEFSVDAQGKEMTTNQGVKINDDQNSLKSGERGSTLLEDFILREKITHFDHERIPERIVHARGAGAHGVFELYKEIPQWSKAHFLNTTEPTPVFVRFSTVAGSKGSTDLARDVRGFAVKFYTQEGNFDLVGNNMPVFFIQDAMKFPDLIHAVKPEPHNEIPQAASAHDTFWDFISLTPESAHMVMWAMSDRALPRSYRMMEGFGVHTFRLINSKGESHFVKFHWKPLLGVHAVTWDEAQKISGKDPDFHRKDLWEAIQNGDFPEWELGLQLIPEADEHKYDFDLLDPTKLVPEELVPVQKIGKMTLNRNPDNYFAETEQAAFHVGHIVPGIDFTNDPLMQGRLFSYTDTQLIRLGGPNFHEIPINRPIVPIHNNQRDGYMRQTINIGQSSYGPNRTGNNFPNQVREADGGFVSYNERIDARKVRARSKSFFDHFSQAKLFLNSQSASEKQHITDALSFELSKVKVVPIRHRVLVMLQEIDKGLAKEVAENLGITQIKELKEALNQNVPADANEVHYQSETKTPKPKSSEALSMQRSIKNEIKTRKIAILLANDATAAVKEIKAIIERAGAMVEIIAPKLGEVSTSEGKLPVDESLLTAASIFYDAVFVPSGKNLSALITEPKAIHFLNEAYLHCKAIAFEKGTEKLIDKTQINPKDDPGIFVGELKKIQNSFIKAIGEHRVWEREKARMIPA